MKNKLGALTLFFLLLLFSNKSYAEGQNGITQIMNLADFLLVVVQLIVYTFFGGILIRFILHHFKANIHNKSLIAFSLSFLMAALVLAILN
ncbi:super-infection exclusion protein B [Paenimyroides aestuarii]|uniref:Super-infection exclusion protein B n=1 Tax=Paenimyroides aestuarii TaxID=2968490 RepID=A0ABY5NV73_9FLAO|nr:super-infection exclusion protein B [Paenimyroides aestuarii]UUV22440.1 super-infection exclusion protein B [Paenimyroides aestuarii]